MKITVRIGAAIDGDLSKILYEPLAQGSSRARAKVRADAKGLSAEELAIKKSQLAQERQLVAQQNAHKLALERDSARQRVREETRVQEEARRQHRRTADDQERVTRRATEAGIRLRKREIEASQREATKTVRSFASSATGTAAGMVRRGVGVAADIARGAGVSFDVGSAVKKRTGLESAAVGLANAGYVEDGKGAQRIKQDPRAIMADIQKTGETYGIAQETIAGALVSFVGKTGELQTGRDMLDAFAKTAKATGADIEDVAAAAGAISNKLGDVPDKANAINKVMLAIAGQGKVGAVEIKDMATQMEKLTSQASKFQTNAAFKGVVGSDTGANIAMLGVLAQAARQTEKGTAAQATQSSMAFIRDLTSATATKRIGAKAIFTDDKKTTIRDPQEIIKDLISKTKGDQSKLTFLMPNRNSRAVVNSFMDPYMKAHNATKGSAKEKDTAGRAAVDDKFKELKQATLSPKAQQEAVDQAMTTTATKVEQFQQKLDRVVGDMADQVIPAMLKLAPSALDAATTLSKIATWAVENPKSAGGAIVAASLAKAMGDQIAAALATKAAGALGAMPMSGLVVSTMVIATVGMMAIDHVVKESDKASRDQYSAEMKALNARTALRAAREQFQKEEAAGGATPETRARLERAKAEATVAKNDLERRVDLGWSAKNDKDMGGPNGPLGAAWNDLLSTFGYDTKNGVLGSGTGKTSSEYEAGEKAAEDFDALREEMAATKREMSLVTAALGKTLKVSVEGGLPGLPNATTGPGGP